MDAPKLYGDVVDPWDQNPLGARQLAVNNVQKVRVSPAQLLTGHKAWATLDYSSIQNPDFQGNLEWTVERAGTGHGIVVLFDAELAEGIGFSNAPGAPETVYGSFFFPWTQPVPLKPEQTVCVNLAAKLVENDYLWRGRRASNRSRDQALLLSILTNRSLPERSCPPRRIAADYIPRLSEEGLLRRRTFELIDGKLSLEEVAHQLSAEFPKRFSSWQEALLYAGVVSQEFSR